MLRFQEDKETSEDLTNPELGREFTRRTLRQIAWDKNINAKLYKMISRCRNREHMNMCLQMRVSSSKSFQCWLLLCKNIVVIY